jgi:hypothetical protein
VNRRREAGTQAETLRQAVVGKAASFAVTQGKAGSFSYENGNRLYEPKAASATLAAFFVSIRYSVTFIESYVLTSREDQDGFEKTESKKLGEGLWETGTHQRRMSNSPGAASVFTKQRRET